jgi:beta-glucanase (GH16 family)
VRSRQYTTGGTPYTVNWELVPTSGPACARTISLAQYTLGSGTARVHVRNGGQDFTAGKALDLGKDVFHTYAVEVAPDHVSWFVDTRVVMTERRDPARSGATYRMQFRMQAPDGARMNTSRMQMDWARYYTLERRSAQPITAPAATVVPADATC